MTVSRVHLLLALPLGVVFWLLGVLMIRYGTVWGFTEGPGRLMLFALLGPATWLAIRRVRRMLRLQAAELAPMVAAITAVAVFCDVLALSFAPMLYAAEPAAVLSGAILIFWGIFCALVPPILAIPARG
jgi:hypothetical protein